MDLIKLIKRLSDADGVNGMDGVSALAAEILSQFGEVEMDSMGGITAFIKGKSNQTVMLDAHIDEIGLIVTDIDGDFLRVAACGGVDKRVLTAQEVTVHGKKNLFGVFCSVPPHIKNDKSDAPDISDMAIDTGLKHDELSAIVSPGDRVSFRQSATELIGGKLTGKSLDNRAGCAAVIAAVQMLCDNAIPQKNVIVSLSAQEEIGLRGAKTATFRNTPDEAIVVDVSFGKFDGIANHKTGRLGGGPMIGISPITDREITERIKVIASACSIPVQYEVMGSSTGTNADVISVTKSGVKTALISIPLLNMHTPTEVIDTSDVEMTARLIARYIGKVKA